MYILIVVGECMFLCFEFKCVLDVGGLVILQLDLFYVGGIIECYKIVGMVEVYDVVLVLYCLLGLIVLVVCLYIDFVLCNVVFQEQSMGIYYNKGVELFDFVKNKEDFSMDGGFFKFLIKLGFGVDIDEVRVIEFSKSVLDWCNLLWWYVDGLVVEW